jgi:TolB protein
MNAIRYLTLALALVGLIQVPAPARAEPLRIIIDQGVIEPLPFAIPTFTSAGGQAPQYAAEIARVIAADLAGTGLFREIPSSAYISGITNFDAPIAYADWKAINAQALVTGAVAVQGSQLTVKFRLFDVFSDTGLGDGLQFTGTTAGWRRMAHKVADVIYSRITGEGGYFDSRVAFVSEQGPKNARVKRLAIMDYDGANVQYLTDGASLVLKPRFSPGGDQLLYTSYETGVPQVFLLDLASLRRTRIGEIGANMSSFAARFSPDGGSVVFSLEQGGNTDLYLMALPGGTLRRLTDGPAIETAPSFSPDGSQIVFESDRSGSPQIYVMPATGGEARRIGNRPGATAPRSGPRAAISSPLPSSTRAGSISA